MSEKLLEISGLSVCYEGEQILNNICFSVEKGETVGIAGESGSGKSTLLRAILRLMGKNGSITGGQICKPTVYYSPLCYRTEGLDGIPSPPCKVTVCQKY